MSVNRKTNSGLQKLAGLYNSLTAKISDLLDVQISNPTNGQAMLYNSTTHKWQNQNLPSGADIFTITLTVTQDPQTGEVTFTSDKLPSEVIAAKNSGSLIRLTATDTIDFYFNLIADSITEESTAFIFSNFNTPSADYQVSYTGFTLVKAENSDTWASIEMISSEAKDTLTIEMEESSGVYSCDTDFDTLDDAYWHSINMFIDFNKEIFRLVKYDSLEDTFYFANTISDSSGTTTKTFVMVGDSSENEWTSITLTESSGGGGSDILILHLSEDEETGDTVCDKTPSEVLAAYQAGTVLFLLDTRYDEFYLFDNYNDYDDYYYMLFSRCEASYTGLIETVTYNLRSSEDEDVWDDIDYDSTDLTFSHAEISLSNGSYSCSISPINMNLSLQYRSSLGVFLKYTEDDTVYNVSYADFTNDVYHFSTVIKDASNNFKLRTFVLTASGNSWGSITMNEIPIVDSTNAIKWSEASTSVKKNWLPNNAVTQTVNGVTFTVNADKSVEVSGTATAATTFYLNQEIYLPLGTYKLTGTPRGGSQAQFKLVLVTTSGAAVGDDIGNGLEFTVSDTSIGYKLYVRVPTEMVGVAGTKTFYPMIRLASIEDDTYVPYIPDNTELVSYADNGILGAKNLFNLNVFSLSTNGSGVSRTKSDNLIEVTCSVKDSGVYIDNSQLRSAFSFITEPCIFSFECKASVEGLVKVCPEYSGLTYYTVGTNWSYYEYTIADTSSMPAFIIYNGENVSKTISVRNFMIRLESDTDSTYQPYAMTNLQLTKNIEDLENLIPGRTYCIRVEANNSQWMDNYAIKLGLTSTMSLQAFCEKLASASYNRSIRLIIHTNNTALSDNTASQIIIDLCNIFEDWSNRIATYVIDVVDINDGRVTITKKDMSLTYIKYAFLDNHWTRSTLRTDYIDYSLDQTKTTSTTTDTVYTFTTGSIHADSTIDVYADIFGVSPSNIQVTDGSCTVTFPAQSAAQSMTCRIYIK